MNTTVYTNNTGLVNPFDLKILRELRNTQLVETKEITISEGISIQQACKKYNYWNDISPKQAIIWNDGKVFISQ